MIEVRACSVAELFDDPRCAELIAEYAEECGNALIGKPAPRRDLYEGIERIGLAQCFAAYENRDHPLDQPQLAGFALIIIAVVPHYGLSCATLESLFVTRDAHCGSELIRVVEEYSRKAGCTAIIYAAPVDSRLARLLLVRSDHYALTNLVFSRRLN